MPEERIAGRYVVEAPIGKGGMGEVFRARDVRLDRAVALKVLPRERVGDGQARARLLREARSAAALGHPNIVHVYDVGEAEDGAAFIAMELVTGRTLRAVLADGPLAPELVSRIVGDVAAALSAAHRAGFVHRDVKPDNIMLRDDGRAVVLDFGLAKPVERDAMLLTDDGSIVGTPAYLSPEQSRGEALTGASDQFALAVTAFELVTGRLPWTAATPMAVLAAIIADEPLRASALRAGVGPPVDAVLARALSKRSADRYPDCAAFAQALDVALRSSGDRIALLETVPSAGSASGGAGRVKAAGGRTSARARWLAGLLVVSSLGAIAWTASRTDSAAAPSASPDVPRPIGTGDVLACPILEVEGSGAEDGWLGAAVASAICDRAVWMLGGRAERTRIPAELLELPTTPAEGATSDAFVAAEARARTERAAARSATVILRGVVRRSGGALAVEVELDRDGPRMGAADARGTVREIAVAITDAWRRAGVLPTDAPIDDEVARWTMVADPTAALALHDLHTAERAMDDTEGPCRVLAERRLGPRVLPTGACPGLDPTPAGAPTSPPELALAAHDAIPLDPALVAALERARSEEASDIGRGRLATAHALALAISDPERALEIMLVAAPLRRRDGAELWMNLSFWANRTALGPTISQAYSEWAPADPDSWATRALVAPIGERLELLRRAHAVAPRNTSAAADLAFASLASGSTAGARAVAAELADGSDDLRFVSEMISIAASSAEGRVAAAQDRARALIDSNEHPITYRRQDYYLVDWVVELTILTGDTSLADAYLRVVLADAASARPDQTQAYEQWVAMLAAVGSPSLARAALELLHTRRPTVLALRALVEGDRAEAARLFRQVLGVEHLASLPFIAAIGCPILESEGSPEVAARVDEILVEEHGLFHGIGTAHLRVARRLAREGDAAGAAAMATRVIGALSSSDRDFAALEEMRRIVADGAP